MPGAQPPQSKKKNNPKTPSNSLSTLKHPAQEWLHFRETLAQNENAGTLLQQQEKRAVNGTEILSMFFPLL